MPGQQLREFLFVDRHFASLERRHPGGVNVHANDRMTNLRETNSGNQSDVTGTYDRNLYGSICSKLDIHNSSSVQQIQNTLAGLARRGGHGYHERAAQPSATSSSTVRSSLSCKRCSRNAGFQAAADPGTHSLIKSLKTGACLAAQEGLAPRMIRAPFRQIATKILTVTSERPADAPRLFERKRKK